MVKTELWNGRPSPKEAYGQLAAFSLNALNLVVPNPATYVAAGAMLVTAGSMTGLEVANLTTPEKKKKWAAVIEGIGVMVANRGAAMTAVGWATHNSDMWMPGFVTFEAGVVLLLIGDKLNQKTNSSETPLKAEYKSPDGQSRG